jgi:hypothetical protein
MDICTIKQRILEFLHEETGWGNPLKPHCEFEELNIQEMKEKPDGSYIINFKYNFDEDGFSQYDKTHLLKGLVEISSSGALIKKTLEQVHAGVATNRKYKPK